ncbi:MAG TPA: ABC transporter permease [Dehalococcoidia bacterium]|nr:ABC transporter permease [Dehalococcoidia bacterium]
MRVFLASAYYTYRGTLAWLTPAMFVGQKLLIPFGQVTFFSLIGRYGGSQPLDFYLIGNAMVLAATACIYIPLVINEERLTGTLQFLAVSPANRLALLTGRISGHLLEGVLWIVIAFGWAATVFGLDIPASTWGGLMVAIVVASLAAIGLGLLLGGLAYLSLDIQISLNGVVFGLLLVSGANIPVEELPGWLAVIGEVLPVTHSIEAARRILAREPLGEAAPLLATDIVIGTTYAVAGLALFGWLESRARRKGTLEGI